MGNIKSKIKNRNLIKASLIRPCTFNLKFKSHNFYNNYNYYYFKPNKKIVFGNNFSFRIKTNNTEGIWDIIYNNMNEWKHIAMENGTYLEHITRIGGRFDNKIIIRTNINNFTLHSLLFIEHD